MNNKNYFQNLISGLSMTRKIMTVPSMLFASSLLLALTISQANGQNLVNGEAKKGIMCYVCNSARDPRCGDPFDSATIEKVDCDQFMPNMNTTICRKTVQRATLGGRSDYRVIRTCGYLPEPPRYGVEVEEDDDGSSERCFNKAGTFEVQLTYCACTVDGCNHGQRLTQSSTFTIASLLTMISGSYLLLNKSFN
ncbi:unnamed protein product [Orchesella dallaii]|uniref:Protein sleepless n=1 Tax=Orchesella dallaii TaxID=48710 RepID=A0ABP1S3Q4_9HEXA